MKKIPLFLCAVSLLAPAAWPASMQALVKVCGNPAAPCKSKHRDFPPYELSMVLPARVKQNTPYKSEVFYAVMLKDKIVVPEAEDCDGGEFHTKVETERKRVQAMFPNNKVFAAHQCPDMGAIGYLINGRMHNENFLAVYAGASILDADQVLQAAKPKYPKATVIKMQAVFENIVQ